jgi:hypothetical protein
MIAAIASKPIGTAGGSHQPQPIPSTEIANSAAHATATAPAAASGASSHAAATPPAAAAAATPMRTFGATGRVVVPLSHCSTAAA